jgi:colanic acid biosynthesis glycosyl transferase WcaI
MRIAIVDYSGHAFPVQLSRCLAERGHQVLHSYFREFQSPHGKLEKAASDSSELTIDPVSLGKPFPKYSFFRRRFMEIEVGKAFAAKIDAFAPDVVLVGNCPLDCVLQIGKKTRRAGRRLIFWQQDIYSSAISRILGRKFGFVGRLIGAYYRQMERRILAMSNATIVISQDFVEAIRTELEMPTANVHVIENWAPLDDIPLRPKQNAWSVKHDLADKKVVLYSGTIGLKHDPEQLLDLAESLKDDTEARLVVISEGPFADWLAEAGRSKGLDNVCFLPFQSYADFPDVLGSADLTVALLEKDAGTFSVPSKILSYLCAGRPIVLSAPPENLAARIVTGCGAGDVVSSGDRAAFVSAVRSLADNPALRLQTGHNARIYAETTFNIGLITTRFEAIFQDTLASQKNPNRSISSAPATAT